MKSTFGPLFFSTYYTIFIISTKIFGTELDCVVNCDTSSFIMEHRDCSESSRLVVLDRRQHGKQACLTPDDVIRQIANVSLTLGNNGDTERHARLAEKVLRVSGIKKSLGAMLQRARLADKWVAATSICRPKDLAALLKAFLRKVVLPTGLLGTNFKRFTRVANLILSRLVFFSCAAGDLLSHGTYMFVNCY